MIATLAVLLLATSADDVPPPRCDAPVYMVVSGETRDRERMIAYARAIAESRLYERLGGYYVTVPRPIEVFEGDVPASHVNLTVRFPCIENARAFWNSRTYQEDILPLRRDPVNAGDYTVIVYAEAQLRADMNGQVGDSRYRGDFPREGIEQVDPLVVGPMAKPPRPDAP